MGISKNNSDYVSESVSEYSLGVIIENGVHVHYRLVSMSSGQSRHVEILKHRMYFDENGVPMSEPYAPQSLFKHTLGLDEQQVSSDNALSYENGRSTSSLQRNKKWFTWL